jgi:hypothetical protein
MKCLDEPCEQGKHIFDDKYDDWGSCSNYGVGCPGWSEGRCKICGWYITEDPCGCDAGMSKKPYKYYVTMQAKKDKAFKERKRHCDVCEFHKECASEGKFGHYAMKDCKRVR